MLASFWCECAFWKQDGRAELGFGPTLILYRNTFSTTAHWSERNAPRYLGEQEVEDIAMGAAVMASGGGGNPYVGILIAKQCVADNGSFRCSRSMMA